MSTDNNSPEIEQPKNPADSWKAVIKAMGLVFGDIGTSPIYTLTICFAITKPTIENVIGILSLVFWSLIIVVTIGYTMLVMSLTRKGEGGTIVLKEILVSLLQKGRLATVVIFASYLGISLMLGDGVITPAISILSALEGIKVIPGMEGFQQSHIIIGAIIIAFFLFFFQSRGTEKVAGFFGPVVAVWFICLAISGLISIFYTPVVLNAINPYFAVKFLYENGFSGFIVLSEVVLCITGVEALYADMGHIGRKPIVRAWYFALVALSLNYLGQGAFALRNPDAENYLFSMVHSFTKFGFIPFLIVTVMTTIIASQAMISGVFSIFYQAITTRIMPLMKVDYTSTHLKSQIYIGFVNWFLFCAVVFVMIFFQKSENLAAAYGLAVTGTMSVTGFMIVMIFPRTARWKLTPVAFVIFLINFTFFFACMTKIPHGGYWSLALAAFPFITILIWKGGHKRLYLSLKPLKFSEFLYGYIQLYNKGKLISGTALFFTRDSKVIPPYVVHTMLASHIIYERNIFVSINVTDDPTGLESQMKRVLGPGLDALEVKVGYMERIDIEKILMENHVKEKVIFYGVEDIVTKNIIWSIFSLIKKTTPNFVQFYKLPPSKLHGVVTRVEM